ncbi:unnamed protein product [Amoebophrya sp. A25]|nr:unnamed protein product [Amoebophrya sp. A25]|eukprot:GSA25T00024152001.1
MCEARQGRKIFAADTSEAAVKATFELARRNQLTPDILNDFGLAMKLTRVTAKVLLESDVAADFIQAKDEDGWTMLHWAAFYGYGDIVEDIVEHGGGYSCSSVINIKQDDRKICVRDRVTVFSETGGTIFGSLNIAVASCSV